MKKLLMLAAVVLGTATMVNAQTEPAKAVTKEVKSAKHKHAKAEKKAEAAKTEAKAEVKAVTPKATPIKVETKTTKPAAKK